MISVLYVDDEPDLLDIAQVFLEQTGGFKVGISTSAKAVLKNASIPLYDAIVADYQMPGMDGIAFLKAVRERYGSIPFILFTGRGREEVVIEAINNGADFYLQKGADPQSQFAELAHQIRLAVRRKEAWRDLHRSGELVQKSEAKFRALVENSLDGILITDFGANLLFVNRAAGKIVDVADYQTVAGKRNVMEFIAPASRKDVLSDFAKVAQGIDSYLAVYQVITDTKRVVWVESIGKRIPFGETEAILISIRDVTERKLAEIALRESEAKFSTVFKSSPVALTLVSAIDGKFIDINDSFIDNTGFSREEVIGRTAGQIGIFADASEYARLVSALRERKNLQGMEVRCRIKSGDIRTCRFTSGIIMMAGIPHILSTVEDITDQKAAESAVHTLVTGMAETTGMESLDRIAESISTWLGADCVMIGEITPDGESVRVLSMLLDGERILNYSYTLNGTPCEKTKEKGFCLYPDDVALLFPESKDLKKFNIRGYAGTPLRNRDGKEIGILCVLTKKPLRISPKAREIVDIIAVKAAAEIERSQLEDSLRRSRRQLEEAMDIAHIANWEYDVATGMFTFDDRFYSLYGTTAEREGGMRMPAETYAREFIPPEERGVVAAEIKKAMMTTDPDFRSQLEHRIIRRDGEIRHIIVRYGVTKDAGGRTIKTHGANQDITELKRAEIELRRSEQRSLVVSENAGSWIWEVDPEGLYRYSSPAVVKILGYRPDELVGKMYFYDLFDPDIREDLEDAARAAFKKREPFRDFVNLNTHRNGNTVILNTSGTPLFDEDGNFAGYCGVDEDITERKKAEEVLRRTNHQLSLLTGITRHDILSKITAMLGYLTIAERKQTDPASLEYFGKMRETIDMIRSQIEFTRIYQTIGSHEPQWFELDAVIPHTYVPVTISLHTDVQGFSIFADPMLEKAFFNLLDNSVRHGQRVTAIRITARQSGPDLVVVWEDNGVGILDEEKERIFERGYGKNTGLGLFLVREVLSLTGITISETGTPGTGARFEMTVPKGTYRTAPA